MSQASDLEPEKSWLSLPSAQGPKEWKFDIPHHCDKSPKGCKQHWLKVFDTNFWSCKYPKHQPWNLKKVGFPFLSPRNHQNGSLTSLIIVISQQKCCKWRWLKVCDANFWSYDCPKHQPWNLKKGWVPFPQPKEPKKWKFGIPHHYNKSPKMFQVVLSKSV